jgi:hypothetical protein
LAAVLYGRTPMLCIGYGEAKAGEGFSPRANLST